MFLLLTLDNTSCCTQTDRWSLQILGWAKTSRRYALNWIELNWIQNEWWIFVLRMIWILAVDRRHAHTHRHSCVRSVPYMYTCPCSAYVHLFISHTTCVCTDRCRYLSPELFEVDGAAYQPEPVDIWALGVMLFVMVVGNYPFATDLLSALYIHAGDW